MHLSFLVVVAWTFVGLVRAGLDLSVLLPTQDSWYAAPNNVSLYAPGEVIKSRQVSNLLNGYSTSTTITVSSSHQIMFRTTDSLGKAVAAVTTLLIPFNSDNTKIWSHATAYDSNNLNCAPSYSLRAGANTTSEVDIVYMAAALNNGWWVSATDFHGLYGQFGAGVMAGQAILDSIRAVLHDGNSYGLKPNPKIGLWGYSGGSIGVDWAIELQQQYAPELKITSAAMGGLASNLYNSFKHANKGVSAGLGIAGIAGLANAYPDFGKLLNQSLIPSKRAEFMQIAGGCLNDITSSGAFKDIFSYVKQGQSFLDQPAAQAALKAGGIAGRRGKPTMPIFIIQAVNDEISAIADTDSLVSALCQKGAIIEYNRDWSTEHITEALTKGPAAFQWMSDRLNGKALTNSQCVTRNNFVNFFNPSQSPALGAIYIATLQTMFYGGDLGWLGLTG